MNIKSSLLGKLSGKRYLWLALPSLIVISVISYNWLKGGIDVKGYPATKKELLITVTGTSTGTVRADREVKLSAQRIGRISKLYVEEGSIVAAGSRIADLESDEMQQRLLLADANLKRLNAQLDAITLGLISFKAEIESNINKADAVFSEAEARLRRFQELKNKGYLSELDLDAVRREYDVAKASKSASIAAREQIKAREQEIKAQSAALEQARREYNLAVIMLDYSFIKSPIAGVVTSRPVKIAETIPLGGLVASVVATDSLYIEAFIDEADAAKVAIGQQVNVTMDAYPGRTLQGEIYMISPVVLGNKQEARTFEARVRLLDSKTALKAGMSADVEVIVSRKENALTIPSQAIIEKNDAKYVYVLKSGRAHLRQIKTGQFNWSFTEITEGLQEGDTVAINPDAAGLNDNSRVKVTESQK